MPTPSKTVPRVCEMCGIDFMAVAAQVKIGGAKYCSRKCYWKSMSIIRRQKAQTSIVGLKCEYCGKTFGQHRSAVDSGRGRFCSRKCKGAMRTDDHSISLNQAPAKVACACVVCGKVMRRYQADIERVSFITCSYACRSVYRSEHYSGEDSWHWRGGPGEYPKGWSTILRREIRDRDDHRCAVCWISEEDNGRLLDVHHIDYDKENLHPDNLVSLCGSCHSKTNYNRDEWQGKFVVYTYSY